MNPRAARSGCPGSRRLVRRRDPAPPRYGWLRALAKVVIGVGGPIVLIILGIQTLTPRPDPAAPPVALTEPEAGTEDAVQLVGSPDGVWELERGLLGYRIVEHYPRLRDPVEAAGRTTEVEAALVVTTGSVTTVHVRADLRALDSGAPNRDDAARVRYLESDDFPWAEFTLREPIPLVPTPQPGVPFTLEAVGPLTIRGVDVDVRAPLQARWDGETVQVVGQLPVMLGDWGVAVPDIPGYVRVDNAAIIELDLTFRRA
jgi:hypothetical protein